MYEEHLVDPRYLIAYSSDGSVRWWPALWPVTWDQFFGIFSKPAEEWRAQDRIRFLFLWSAFSTSLLLWLSYAVLLLRWVLKKTRSFNQFLNRNTILLNNPFKFLSALALFPVLLAFHVPAVLVSNWQGDEAGQANGERRIYPELPRLEAWDPVTDELSMDYPHNVSVERYFQSEFVIYFPFSNSGLTPEAAELAKTAAGQIVAKCEATDAQVYARLLSYGSATEAEIDGLREGHLLYRRNLQLAEHLYRLGIPARNFRLDAFPSDRRCKTHKGVREPMDRRIEITIYCAYEMPPVSRPQASCSQ